MSQVVAFGVRQCRVVTDQQAECQRSRRAWDVLLNRLAQVLSNRPSLPLDPAGLFDDADSLGEAPLSRCAIDPTICFYVVALFKCWRWRDEEQALLRFAFAVAPSKGGKSA